MADNLLTSKIYFGELLVGKATLERANYVKIDKTAPFASSTSGSVLEYGAGWDISDVVNNPPKLIGSDGNEITSLDGTREITEYYANSTYLVYADGIDNTLFIDLANGLPSGTWDYVED